MDKFAIIKTGGKQYKVKEKDVLKIEKIPGKAGDKVEFEQVLMTMDALRPGSLRQSSESLTGSLRVEIGKPFLEGKKVEGKILEQGKSKKVLVIKYKPKTRYKKRVGHRQMFTKVEISNIM